MTEHSAHSRNTDRDPADTLREAAELMRWRALAATPGPDFSGLVTDKLKGAPSLGDGSFTWLEIDHIVPIARGGADKDESNMQPLCTKCNVRKGTRL